MTALARQALAELRDTMLLVTTVIGSGIAAQRLSPDDVGLQRLANATATGAVLATLILASARHRWGSGVVTTRAGHGRHDRVLHPDAAAGELATTVESTDLSAGATGARRQPASEGTS